MVAFGAQKTRTHTLKKVEGVTVWYGFWPRAIIWPFFFENEQGEAVTVNGDCYLDMLNEFSLTKIEEKDIDSI